MIVVKLMGGLGNQMFQYAAGRCLSHLRKTELKLDLSFLNTDPKGAYTKRDFELDTFNLKYTQAGTKDLEYFEKVTRNPIIRKLKQTWPGFSSKIVANESGHFYHKEFYNYPENVYLNGFWQCEKYFMSVREILLKEFVPKDTLNEEAEGIRSSILDSNSVSVHVRRGDYVTLKGARDFHGLCGVDYYVKAIEMMKQRQGGVKLFIFSDDMEWVKENLKPDSDSVLVSGRTGSKACVDVYLMSLCKHNIIANSSFSWWGAWLNANADKMVIAPGQWFSDPSANARDIYPDNWIKL